MYVQSLWNKLFRFLNASKSEDQLDSIPAVSEQNRLIHRLNCVKLDDEEAKCLNAYLTTVLEARCLESTSELTTTEKSDCIVLEMGEEELRNFSQVLGAHGLRTFRAIVESEDSQTQARKLTVIGEHGLRLFQVHVQNGYRSSIAETPTT
jgi:hypothetical protein